MHEQGSFSPPPHESGKSLFSLTCFVQRVNIVWKGLPPFARIVQAGIAQEHVKTHYNWNQVLFAFFLSFFLCSGERVQVNVFK